MGFHAMPEESALHFDADQCERLARAFARCGVRQLVAVSTEEGAASLPALAFDATEQDLGDFSFETSHFSYLVLGIQEAPAAVLCSNPFDTLLVAGRREFLEAYFGNLHRALAEYRTFSEVHSEPLLKPRLRSYLAHASWLEAP
jgi:hypothetical protein